ncbi:hypothetical protein SC10_B2orf01277 [Bacillus paralicheniformis]|nr:hypothetical protein SC10_B2orf01277 [Bacillus paralicheniformis]
MISAGCSRRINRRKPCCPSFYEGNGRAFFIFESAIKIC